MDNSEEIERLDDIVGNLAMLVARLTGALRSACDKDDLRLKVANQAADYLRRCGFQKSILRRNTPKEVGNE